MSTGSTKYNKSYKEPHKQNKSYVLTEKTPQWDQVRFQPEPEKELKNYDTNVNAPAGPTGTIPGGGQGAWVSVTQDETGTGRIGNEILVKLIQFRGYANFAPAQASGSVSLHIFVILDTQCNGTLPSVLDIFTSVNLGKCLLNPANTQRFKILKTYNRYFTPLTFTTGFCRGDIFNWYIPCDIPIKFNSPDGDVGSVTTNNIFICMGTDIETEATDTFSVVGTARVCYYDC